MELLLMMIDESSSARLVLADMRRVIRAIVDDVFGVRHDGRLKLPRWRQSVPQGFVCTGQRMVPA